jgi:hypothetical protein
VKSNNGIKNKINFVIFISIFMLFMEISYAGSIPVTFAKLTGHTGSFPKRTGVYRADLSGLPLTTLRSITITDNSNGLGGANGKFSGFDLDAIMLSNSFVSTASDAKRLLALPLFDFTPAGAIFDQGRQRPPTDPKLFGTDVRGNHVDAAVARLDLFDGKGMRLMSNSGFVSLGDRGTISFNLTASVSLNSLFLYIGEVGDNGEVAAGEILISDIPVKSASETPTMLQSFPDTDNSWNGSVHSTRNSRLFHRPDCSKISSKDGDLITFPSKENAEKNGGKPCPECNP